MKASDLFVRTLEAEGVEYVFAVPGEENLDVLESLRNSRIRLVVTRHEQAAGFMAATYGRLTGRPGVALSTLGPGATNLVTAAGFAQLGAMPMVMITGQKPIKSSKQGAFQILDVVHMMAPLTKYTRQVVSSAYLPSRVREAFRVARDERPGATHLEIPEDILREESEVKPLEASYVRLPVADERSIDAAVDLLNGARSPLLVLASGANRTRACHRIEDFVQRLGIPFLSTQMGKGVVDERSDRYLGTAALSSGDFVHRAVEQADVIVNVGHNVVEKPPFIMEDNGVKVVHVDFNSAEVDPVYFPQVEVVGDIAHSFDRLLERLEEPGKGWDFSHLPALRGAAQGHFRERAASDHFPMKPERLVADVRRVLPSESILALDNGMYKIWFARNYPAHGQNSLLLDNALATMGAGFPSAMAARLVHPDRPVVAVCGDGGFMMNSQELETAVRLGLDLVVVVVRDDGYGMIRWKQEEMGFPDFGLSYGNPDFVAYAAAYGARGHRVESAGTFAALLASCLERPGIDVIELPVTYEDDHRILNQEIPELARRFAAAGGAS
jgi:acetolactate synthase I/II/III large subunit